MRAAEIASPERPALSGRWLVAVGLALLAAVVIFVVDHSYSIYDDSYIYLRYVKNLRGGCGLRFNCGGAPVEGFTSPLYLAALTAGSLLVSDLEGLTQLFGTMFLTLSLVVTASTAQRMGLERRTTVLVTLLGVATILGVDHRVLLNAVTGLETSLACLIVALLVRAAFDPRAPWLRTLVVAAVLTRPECLIFVVLLPLLPRARSWRYLAPVGIALVGLALVRWEIFGALVPNTYLAKSGGTLQHARLGADYALGAVTDFPAIVLAPLAFLLRSTRATVRWVLLSSLVWFAFFLRSGGDAFQYSRLALPLVPTLTLLAIAGASAACERIADRLVVWRRVCAPALVAFLAVGAVRARVAHATEPQHGFALVQGYEDVGAFLHVWYPGASVAAVPVGAIGYLSDGHVYDIVGLVTKEVAVAGRGLPPERLTRESIGHERHNTQWVLAQQPQIIVTSTYRRRVSGAPRAPESWWTDVGKLGVGMYPEQLILREVREGRAPYQLYNAEVAPGVYWALLLRNDLPLPETGNPPWL